MNHDARVNQIKLEIQNNPLMKARDELEKRKTAEGDPETYLRYLETLVENLTAELATTTQQLHHAQKMEAIGTLAGGISHDFNNILQTISGYTQILLEEKGPADPDHNKLVAVHKAAHRAGDLIKRLLVFSRKMESELKPLNLNREITETIKILRRTIQKMIRIELSLDENINIVNADPVQVEQIIMNLVINARDAMPDGGKMTFETENVVMGESFCKTHRGSKPGKYILLAISDTGTGMDQKTLKHIFEPFFTTKKSNGGTGLGLSTVYGVVKNHGGYITCSSAPGKGTTFRIFFPMANAANTARTITQKENAIIRGQETLLLVDDEETVLDVDQQMLTRTGYTILTAQSGEEALERYKVEKEHIDLVLLDLNMPGMGGYRCLKELRKAEKKLIQSILKMEEDEIKHNLHIDNFTCTIL